MRIRRDRRMIVALVTVAVVALAGCGGSSKPSAADHSSSGTTLTISNESGGTWTCGFNPFNPDVNFLSIGVVYEPLYFIDSLTGKQTPWLAASYRWSDRDQTLTWTVRPGVRFSNGKPLGARDVVYTFNLLKKDPALDLNALWQLLASVTQKGSNQVVMTFKGSGMSDFYYIADQTPIVPESSWEGVSNPTTYEDKQPVGSGPYLMKTCTPENITYVKNPRYWQPGLPKISRVEYPAFTSNTPANQELADGTAQWGGQFIPDIKAFYLNKSSSYHDWFPTDNDLILFPNLKNPLLSNLAVRQAISYGINRPRISQLAEYGYEPPANQSGVLLPEERSWFDSALTKTYGSYTYDPKKAVSLLESAGFKRGTDGVFQSPSGKPLSFSIINIGGDSNSVAAVQVLSSELKAVGIKFTAQNLASSTYDSDLEEGRFQMAWGNSDGITDEGPYNILRGLLYSPETAPIGKAAASDYERYASPSTDRIFDELAATDSASGQRRLMGQLEAVMMKDVPVIPVTEGVDWYQYDTGIASNWPTPSDPYAQPALYDVPDWGYVLLHLVPTR